MVLNRKMSIPGFSYVDDPSLLATNNHEVAHDLLRFLQKLAKLRPDLSTRPFFVFCESYGGKFASELGVLIYKAVAAKKLDLKLEGVCVPLIQLWANIGN